MKSYAVISDVHSNLEALQSVLYGLEREKPERIFFIGDSVGYGPDPDACVELLKEHCDFMLAGNHDHAAAGLANLAFFNPGARTAIIWTSEVMSQRQIAFLRKLPLTQVLPDDSIFFVHATPRDPEQWHYLSGISDARINFHYFDEQICFVGHSHIPFIIERDHEGQLLFLESEAEIRSGCRYIVNAGSVGQPRDGDPEAAYVMVREGVMRIKRIPYDILLTQKKMKKAGLPDFLIERLSAGR
jgi:diadenosine tetraphosphatase ApaH/serine/threonine PP2A family protein phosphatase